MKAEIYRFNPEKGEWKRISVEKTGDGIFFRAEQGVKGEDRGRQSIVLKLDEKEVAYLAMKLEKML